MATIRHPRVPARLGADPASRPLAALAALLAFGAPGAGAGDPTCQGKPATIVSNAATITGTKAPDVIVAGPGDNTIHGEGGNDLICARRRQRHRLRRTRRRQDLRRRRRRHDLWRTRLRPPRRRRRQRQDLRRTRLRPDRRRRRHRPGRGRTGQRHRRRRRRRRRHGRGQPGRRHARRRRRQRRRDHRRHRQRQDRRRPRRTRHRRLRRAPAARSTINLATQTVTGAENEHLEGIEDAIGGSGDDTLIGSSEANRLDGGPGNDHLEAARPRRRSLRRPRLRPVHRRLRRRNVLRPGGRRQRPRGRNLRVDRRQVDADPDRHLRHRPGHGQLLRRQAASISGSDVTNGDPTNPDCTGSGTITCTGKVDAIEATLGAGDDELTIGQSVPHSVPSTLEGGTGSDKLVGGPANDVLYAGEDHDSRHARRRRRQRRPLRRQHLPPEERLGRGDDERRPRLAT